MQVLDILKSVDKQCKPSAVGRVASRRNLTVMGVPTSLHPDRRQAFSISRSPCSVSMRQHCHVVDGHVARKQLSSMRGNIALRDAAARSVHHHDQGYTSIEVRSPLSCHSIARRIDGARSAGASANAIIAKNGNDHSKFTKQMRVGGYQFRPGSNVMRCQSENHPEAQLLVTFTHLAMLLRTGRRRHPDMRINCDSTAPRRRSQILWNNAAGSHTVHLQGYAKCSSQRWVRGADARGKKPTSGRLPLHGIPQIQ